MLTCESKTRDFSCFEKTGYLQSAQGVFYANIKARIGERIWIRQEDGTLVPSEVIAFNAEQAQLMPLTVDNRFRKGDLVIGSGENSRIPVGSCLLGRVLNSDGVPIDSKGELNTNQYVELNSSPPAALNRSPIKKKFETGIRAIDGLLTIGCGQRVGIFSGSGVGKSTLLGNIAAHAESDVNVVALVGERGREVRPFVEQSLGAAGLKKSVVIVSTSDEPPLCRIRAVENAVAVANWFRELGKNVLIMVDSITRFATAQRELGILVGEPPIARGYPPSVFQRLASLLEQLGNSDVGSITGLLTVLVDGDDMDNPVADAARSILDGHIVLSRSIAERNQFPAIDILASVSRLSNELMSTDHRSNAGEVKQTIAQYSQAEDLIQIGAYKKGNVAATDKAIECMPKITRFLAQSNEKSSMGATEEKLSVLARSCHLSVSE